MTKAQGRRSNKGKGKYKDRFLITERNKARRAKKRERLASSPKVLERKAIRLARAEAKYIANCNRRKAKAEAKVAAVAAEAVSVK